MYGPLGSYSISMFPVALEDTLSGCPRHETKMMENEKMDIYVAVISLPKLSPHYPVCVWGGQSIELIKCHIIASSCTMD